MSNTAKMEAVKAYKQLLRSYLESRPPGIRRKISIAIETDRSFVSQITNPKYPAPIPPQHVSKIMAACDLTSMERTEFLEAYRQAHPVRSDQMVGTTSAEDSQLLIDLSMVADELERAGIKHALRNLADSMVALSCLRGTGGTCRLSSPISTTKPSSACFEPAERRQIEAELEIAQTELILALAEQDGSIDAEPPF